MITKLTRGEGRGYKVQLPDGTIVKPYYQTRMLADGTQKDFWYAWRGPPLGPLLIGEKETPAWMGCLIAAYADIVDGKDQRRQTIQAVLEKSHGLSNRDIAGAIVDALDELERAHFGEFPTGQSFFSKLQNFAKSKKVPS